MRPIAQQENRSNLRDMCELLFGMVDICSVLLVAKTALLLKCGKTDGQKE